MSIFSSFKRNKNPISETEFVKEYEFINDGKLFHVIITKARANKYSFIHCLDTHIEWEQKTRTPRLIGLGGIEKKFESIPIYKFGAKQDATVIFVIRGRPGMIIGLDDGIFRSVHRFDSGSINVMSEERFKSL